MKRLRGQDAPAQAGVTRWVLLGAALCASARAAGAAPGDGDTGESWAVHGQFTYVEQGTSGFNAPYAGTNSLTPDRGAETTDATLYLGARLWPGAEGWLNGEIDQGFGLDNTLGVAGFPSGEAYKVGRNEPYLRLPRLFVRQTINLGGDLQKAGGAANQLGGAYGANRVVITAGKFSVGDIFDMNQFAHDPRGDFLNWAVIDAGTFDYAADAWGYSAGTALEWYQNAWTLRAGVFDLSNVPNSPHLDPGFHEFQSLLEIEHRHVLAGSPGRLLLTAFDSRGRMGLLDDAVRLSVSTGGPVDIAAVRRYRSRLGASLDLEQQLTSEWGLFARLGRAAGNVETYEFSDIDRSVSAGLSLRGTAWRRADDRLGLSAIDNGISAARERFLNAGGLGILVGDGRLPHPGPERIIEAYYSLALVGAVHVTVDYQWIDHPAYNSDRGPVSVVAVRLHAQF